MATSGDLISLLARQFNLPDVTVKNTYRTLREAGLVPLSGRGPKSAAPVTAETCAKMLIALCGARHEKETAEKILENYRDVFSVEGPMGGNWFGPDGDYSNPDGVGGKFHLMPGYLKNLTSLKEGHSLIEALTTIIEEACNDAFDFSLRGKSPYSHNTSISVEFSGAPTTGAIINIIYLMNGISRNYDRWDSSVCYEKFEWTRKNSEEKMNFLNAVDFSVLRKFRQPTIIALANMIKSGVAR